jgi:uncharacterized membrane protein
VGLFDRSLQAQLTLLGIMELTSPRTKQLSSKGFLSLSVSLGLLAFLLMPNSLDLEIRIFSGWIAGVVCFLIRTLIMMKNATAEQTRDRSQRRQAKQSLLLGVVVLIVLISIFAIGFMLSTAIDAPPLMFASRIGLSVLAILCSWFLLHLSFAQQYATLYYRPQSATSTEPAGGLRFVNEKFPAYWDFLYFAFVIGATAQTSDTFIASRPLRRLVLGQGLMSFLFFVGIVAMCVNIGTSLLEAGQQAG